MVSAPPCMRELEWTVSATTDGFSGVSFSVDEDKLKPRFFFSVITFSF
jgi:hypothetical protein